MPRSPRATITQSATFTISAARSTACGFSILAISGRRVWSRYSPTQLPVIMVTAEGHSASIVEALQMGANDYITKPVDMPVALARIRTLLSQKTLSTALRESEDRYARAARGANDGLWDWDLEKGEIYYSPRWKEMLGYRDGEIGQRPEEWLCRVHPDDFPRLQAAVATHCRREIPQLECEQRMHCKDGTYRWMLSRGLAVWNETRSEEHTSELQSLRH